MCATPRARHPSQLGCWCSRADEYDSQAGEGAALVQEEAVQDELVRELWKGSPHHVVDLPPLPESEAIRELEDEKSEVTRLFNEEHDRAVLSQMLNEAASKRHRCRSR